MELKIKKIAGTDNEFKLTAVLTKGKVLAIMNALLVSNTTDCLDILFSMRESLKDTNGRNILDKI